MSDRWAQWLLHDRFGGDEVVWSRTLEYLSPVRDRVVATAGIGTGDVVLDVGCGDGLIGFAAIDQCAHVIFADVSDELLDRCRSSAAALGVVDRCSFVNAEAERLDGVADGSVDVVTTRSVLIYVADKQAAFDAFHRVLRPGGRLSLFEPINRRSVELNRDTLFGFDAAPIADLAARVSARFEAAVPAEGPMMGFDETDLLRLAESAGFEDVTVVLELTVACRPIFSGVSWDQLMNVRPNPDAPTFGDAIVDALDAAEQRELEAHLRPLVAAGTGGKRRDAAAYVTATRC